MYIIKKIKVENERWQVFNYVLLGVYIKKNSIFYHFEIMKEQKVILANYFSVIKIMNIINNI
jgi:hypothetical protein